jgi:hypothetical protein
VAELSEPWVEDAALVERFEAAGIESGDAVSMAEWFEAATDWALQGWSDQVPALSGTAGVAQGVMFLVVGFLAVVAVRWLLRQRTASRVRQDRSDHHIVLPSQVDPRLLLEAALAAGEVDAVLAACWLVVEHDLEQSGVVKRRADRSAYELVAAVRSAEPAVLLEPPLRRLAHTYVRLRYGPQEPSPREVGALADSVKAFAKRLSVEVTA